MIKSDFVENGWMREISGRLLAVRKRAGARGDMRESPAECGRVGNYEQPPTQIKSNQESVAESLSMTSGLVGGVHLRGNFGMLS